MGSSMWSALRAQVCNVLQMTRATKTILHDCEVQAGRTGRNSSAMAAMRSRAAQQAARSQRSKEDRSAAPRRSTAQPSAGPGR